MAAKVKNETNISWDKIILDKDLMKQNPARVRPICQKRLEELCKHIKGIV